MTNHVTTGRPERANVPARAGVAASSGEYAAVPAWRPDPWPALLDWFPGTPVFYRVSTDTYGETVWHEDGSTAVYLAIDLSPVQQRCTLAHELHHLIEGPPRVSFDDANEAAVREGTARWLLPDFEEFCDALRTFDAASAAAHLAVTVGVLNDRVLTMTSEERQQLAELLEVRPPVVRSAATGPRRGPAQV